MEAMTVQPSGNRDIEKLAREMGAVIEKARPEEREELCQMASDLIREEVARTQGRAVDSAAAAKRPLNSLALGLFVLILGAGLSVLVPPVGLLLAGGGLATIVLGGMYRLVTK